MSRNAGAKPDEPEKPAIRRPRFSKSFLEQHAGRIVQDPETAITELVANAWDAGATVVDITWPADAGEMLVVQDDGTGMTREEFEDRWMTLHYNRLESQGTTVEFPKGAKRSARTAYGRNGLGRHAAFYFAERYEVHTAKDGLLTKERVTRTAGEAPYELTFLGQEETSEHGTTVRVEVQRPGLLWFEVRDLLSGRFFVDPDFSVVLNGNEIELLDVEQLEVREVPVEDVGTARVRRIDWEERAPTAKHNGVAWWVNKRLARPPSWDLGNGAILDNRFSAARKHTYIVELDELEPFVRPDWSGIMPAPDVIAAERAIDDFVREDLNTVLGSARRARKRRAIEQSKETLQHLTPLSQDHIAEFIDEVQKQCPSLGEKELNDAVHVLAKLEESRSG
ncbi:MAG: ATP-binding protein [Polyangiaceae bacterium]